MLLLQAVKTLGKIAEDQLYMTPSGIDESSLFSNLQQTTPNILFSNIDLDLSPPPNHLKSNNDSENPYFLFSFQV